ncbi:hypothetical protein ACWKW9_23880 [Rhizobium daejeonense]
MVSLYAEPRKIVDVDETVVPAISYGTEVWLFQNGGHDVIICEPGDISRAHKPNEWTGVDELQALSSHDKTRCNG